MAPAETLTVPTERHGLSMRASSSPNRSKKTWASRAPFISSKSRSNENEERLSREDTRQSRRSTVSKDAWWRTRLFSGMINDIRRRAPFYWSDWKDAWDYRVVPATVYMYFAKYVRHQYKIYTIHPAHQYDATRHKTLNKLFFFGLLRLCR
jgi:boron transporter